MECRTIVPLNTISILNVSCVIMLHTQNVLRIGKWINVWDTMNNCCPDMKKRKGVFQRILRKTLITWNQQHKSLLVCKWGKKNLIHQQSFVHREQDNCQGMG